MLRFREDIKCMCIKAISNEICSVYFLKNEAVNEKILSQIFYLFLNIGYSPVNYSFLSRPELVKFKFFLV